MVQCDSIRDSLDEVRRGRSAFFDFFRHSQAEKFRRVVSRSIVRKTLYLKAEIHVEFMCEQIFFGHFEK
jgi:hypothetical protein